LFVVWTQAQRARFAFDGRVVDVQRVCQGISMSIMVL
jgi:hypothetical protein